jgi:hypothetical protein
MYVIVWLVNLKVTDHVENLGVDGSYYSGLVK